MELTETERKQLEKTIGLELYEHSLYETEFVTASEWDHHGAVHRVLKNDPASIVLGIMIRARSYWNQDALSRPRKRNVDFYSSYLLSAIGTKDGQLLAEMKKSLPMDARWDGWDWESCSYEILIALLHGDWTLAVEKTEAARKKQKKFPSWGLPILAALASIGADQPEDLKDAILAALANVKKVQAIDPVYKVVYPVAHHLWQIGEFCRPGMLADWLPPPKLPWDQAYHKLLQEIPDAREVIDWNRANETFRKWVQILPWE